MLSRRAMWDAPENSLTRAVARRRAHGAELLDLTGSNPTRAGIDYPLERMEQLLARAAHEPYAPEPLGMRQAREALAVAMSHGSDAVSPDDVVVTASTSEAYGFLFKLLCDPGDAVLTTVPGYPLFEHLAALESVTLHSFPLEWHARWELNVHELERALTPRTRAIILVHPNNPTGSYVRARELAAVDALAAERGIAVISDEVFYDYPLRDVPDRAATAARSCTALTFSLGGLSKSAGLPHWKLGWMRVGGPPAAREAALRGLELIADSYLSVSTPVQAALPEILTGVAPMVRTAISARTRANLDALESLASTVASVRVIPPEGGWSAVIRVPRMASDEETVLALLEECGVLVHPGYFFDFPGEGFLIVSLLSRPDAFVEGARRMLATAAR